MELDIQEFWRDDLINLRFATGVLVNGHWFETLPGQCQVIYSSRLQPREARGTEDDLWISLTPRSGKGSITFRLRDLNAAEVLFPQEAFDMLAQHFQASGLKIELSAKTNKPSEVSPEDVPSVLKDEYDIELGEHTFALDDPQLSDFLYNLRMIDDPQSFRATKRGMFWFMDTDGPIQINVRVTFLPEAES